MWIQVIVTVFVLFVLARLVANYRLERSSLPKLVAWIVVWLAVVTVFWSPDIASRLAVFFGIGRGADLIVYIAIIVIIYLLYRVFIHLDKIEKSITAITRKDALDNAERTDNSSNTDSES